jgi:hypothetical protein
VANSYLPMIETLPRSLRDQVLGYIAAVHAASEAIFSEAGVQRTDELEQALLSVAALRKIYGVVNSSYWAVDNSLSLTQNGQTGSVRIGGARYSKVSEEYLALRRLHLDMETMVGRLELRSLIEADSYADVVLLLANEHR